MTSFRHGLAPAFAALEVDPFEHRSRRALLNDLAHLAQEGVVLERRHIRDAQALESMGLCTIEWERYASTTWGDYAGHAFITAAGRRLLGGPQLAAVGGRAVEDWRQHQGTHPPRGCDRERRG